MDICFYRISSSNAPLFVSFVETTLNFINGTQGSKQQTVKYQPNRYESFLSLDTLDQVLRLTKYVSFLRSGPRDRLLVNLVPIDAQTKNCETHPKQCARNIIIDTLFSVFFFFFFFKGSPFHCGNDFSSSLRLKILCYCSTMVACLYFTPNHMVYIRLVLKTYPFPLKCHFF